MKKLLLSVTFAALTGIGAAYGQCTPDPQYTEPGIYPDSATNMGPAFGGIAYSQLVTIVVPADTTVEVIPGFPTTLSMDSINLLNISGMPPGFIYECVPNSCSFPGDATHCAIITGNPTPADTGHYDLFVELDVYVGGNTTPVPTTVSYYDIVVYDSAILAVPELYKTAFTLMQNQPNPAQESTEIVFTTNMPGKFDLKVVDILGKTVFDQTVSAQQGINRVPLNTATMRQGIYLYSLTRGDVTQTRRMVINK